MAAEQKKKKTQHEIESNAFPSSITRPFKSKAAQKARRPARQAFWPGPACQRLAGRKPGLIRPHALKKGLFQAQIQEKAQKLTKKGQKHARNLFKAGWPGKGSTWPAKEGRPLPSPASAILWWACQASNRQDVGPTCLSSPA